MDSISLQNYIVSNNLIPFILSDLRCKDIKDCGKEYRSTRPDGDNPTSLAVDKSTLKVYCYSTNWSGNIYTLTMNVYNITLGQALLYICNLLGLEYTPSLIVKKDKAQDILSIFTKYKNRSLDINDNEFIDDIVLDNYQPYLHISWVKEGITDYTRKAFNIQYDGERRKIIIPHTDWESGNVIGVMSRTTLPNYDILKIPKYYPVIPYQKGNNLYGLYENYNSIIKNGYVVVYEAEKSVLKRYSLHDQTGVAVCTHSITDKQAEILISLNVDIIIAWDKDVEDKDIFKACKKINKIRNVYYIKDTDDLLGEHDSPADVDNNSFHKLFNNKIKYKEEI